MSKTEPISTKSPVPASSASRAVVPGAVTFGLDLADRSNTTVIAILQDARGELRAVVDGALELGDNAARAVFRFARKTAQRIDEATAETLTSLERTLGGTIRTARDTATAAAELASTTAAGLTGGERTPATASA
jgi:hypothetical protein